MSSQFTYILNLPNPKDEYKSNFEEKKKTRTNRIL